MMNDLLNYTRINQLEEAAKDILPENTWKFVQGQVERGAAYSDSIHQFDRIHLKMRALRGVGQRDLSSSLLGESVSLPIGVAPLGYQKLFHHNGDTATAKGVRKQGSCFILSSFTTSLISDVANVFNDGHHEHQPKNTLQSTQSPPNQPGFGWVQTYMFRKRDAMLDMIKDAEKLGFKALVVTLDSAVRPWGREPDKLHVPPDVTLETLHQYGIMGDKNSDAQKLANSDLHDPDVTWRDLKWLVDNTRLPVVAKGVMTSEDARLAVKHGASAIIVSNHGGRQLDAARSTICVLSDIVSAVGTDVEVYLDGGIRYGSDVFKALALGARAVFIGRPAIWGLACGGETGVERALKILKEELDTTMALTGCRTISEINKSCLHVNPIFFNSHL